MKNKILSKIYTLGKCAYTSNRKINECDFEYSLYETNEGIVFTMSGHIWNPNKTDCVSCGQMCDNILEYFPDDTKAARMVEIWKRYHLNDMHAGCIHQKEYENHPYEQNEGKHCDICNYTYGTLWKFEPIPHSIIDEIKSW